VGKIKKIVLTIMALLVASMLSAQSVKSKRISTFDGDAIEYSVKLGGEEIYTGFYIGKTTSGASNTFWIEFYMDYTGGKNVASAITGTVNLMSLEWDTGGTRHKIILAPDDIKVGQSAMVLLDAQSYRESFRVFLTKEQFLEIVGGESFAYFVETRTGNSKLVKYSEKKWSKIVKNLTKLKEA
jgi:hypothetical protein